MARALEAAAPLEVVGQLAVVHDRDVGERVGPVGVGAGDVDVGLGRHAHVADGVRAREDVEVVLLRHRLGVAEVLDDLERVPEREHLGAGHVLDVVDEPLQVAVVLEGDAVGVLGLAVEHVDRGAELPQPRARPRPVALEPVEEVEVARVVRVGELVAA